MVQGHFPTIIESRSTTTRTESGHIFAMSSKVVANFTNLLATGVSLWITSALFDGFSFNTVESLVITTVLLTLINIFVKPIILILAIPLAVVSLGLVIPLINGAVLLGLAEVIPNFGITSFFQAVFAALLVSIISTLIYVALGNHKTFVSVKRSNDFCSETQNYNRRDEEFSREKKTTIDVDVREKK